MKVKDQLKKKRSSEKDVNDIQDSASDSSEDEDMPLSALKGESPKKKNSNFQTLKGLAVKNDVEFYIPETLVRINKTFKSYTT